MALRGAGFGRGALLLALLSTLLSPQPSRAAARSRWVLPAGYGLQGGWAVDEVGNTGFAHSVSAALPLMQQAGAGWVRINFRLGDCFGDWVSTGCDGRTALEAYDDVIRAAERQGLSVLGLISNESWRGEQPLWLENNAEHTGGSGDNDYLRTFSAGAAVPLVAYFEGRITLWEVWNEPNCYTAHDGARGYSGGTFLYPSNLAWLLRHVYEDTRLAGIRGARFISGGLFSHDGAPLALTITAGEIVAAVRQGSGGLRGSQGQRGGPQDDEMPRGIDLTFDQGGAGYLAATYQYGRSLAGWGQVKARFGSYPLDGIGQHLYIDQGRATEGASIAAYLQVVRDAYVAFEGQETAKRTYVTEFGWQTHAVAPALQASNLQVAYATFAETPYVAQAYWYAAQDIPAASSYYGLSCADGSPKPAFAAFQAAVGQAGPP